MGCHGNHAFKHSQNKFFSRDIFSGGHDWGPNGNFSWGSKVDQIRSPGTCNMILFASFSDFSSFFVFFTPPPPPPKKKKKKKKKTFPHEFFEAFFSMKQDTFLVLKLLKTFLKELVVGQGSFSAICTVLLLSLHFKARLIVFIQAEFLVQF